MLCPFTVVQNFVLRIGCQNLTSTNQARKAITPNSPARTPQATLDRLAAPVNTSGPKPELGLELGLKLAIGFALELVAAGANEVAATAAVVAAALGLLLPKPGPEPLPAPDEPEPEPEPEIGVAFALGIGISPTSPPPGALPAFPPLAGDVGCAVTKVTCGTVTAVVYVLPLAVCVNVTVVTGTATGGVEPGISGLGPLPAPFVTLAV